MGLKAKLGCGALVIIALILRFSVFSMCFEPPTCSIQTAFRVWYDYFSVADANPADGLFRYGSNYVFSDVSELSQSDLYAEKEAFEKAAESDSAAFNALRNAVVGMLTSHRVAESVSPALSEAHEKLLKDYEELYELWDAYGNAMREYLVYAFEHYGDIAGDNGAAVSELEDKALAAWTVYKENRIPIMDRIGLDFGVFAEELVKL